MQQKTTVIVLGGGYAGVLAANRLTQRDDVAVTLINSRPEFVERIRLHQLAAGSDDAVVAYREILAESVDLVVDTATRIDVAARGVDLASGSRLGYDYLVYAVGSSGAVPSVPGAAEHAFPVATLEAARRLRAALLAAPATAPLTVVGGGPTGIEAAAELAETGRPVTLICGGGLGPYLHSKGRRRVARRLEALGVTVVVGAHAARVGRDSVQLDDGREIPSAATVWTAGFTVPGLARESGLATDDVGRLRTDETLTSVDDPRIVAAGDCAAPSDSPFRMSCQAALQLAPRAADTVLARIAGTEPAELDVVFAGQCLSLGRDDGIFQFARPADTAVGLHLAGRPGAGLKEFICRNTVQQLANEARRPGARTLRLREPKRRARLRTPARAVQAEA